MGQNGFRSTSVEVAVLDVLRKFGGSVRCCVITDCVEDWAHSTTRQALRRLVDRGEVTFTGPNGNRFYRLRE